jgi:hypothetical protein
MLSYKEEIQLVKTTCDWKSFSNTLQLEYGHWTNWQLIFSVLKLILVQIFLTAERRKLFLLPQQFVSASLEIQ